MLEHGELALNKQNYNASLDTVIEQAKRLGDGMNSIAEHAKSTDARAFCDSVRQAALAVCGLTEGAAQSAYLVGITQPSRRLPILIAGRQTLDGSIEMIRSVRQFRGLSLRDDYLFQLFQT